MTAATASSAADEANRSGPRTRFVVVGLMLSVFLVALDGTIVSTAMPSIVGNLGGFNLYAWVPSVYLLSSAVSTPIYGKLADLFGRKLVLFAGIGLFLLGSVLSGAAPSMLTLIVFRAIQGLGAGAVLPISLTVVGDLFSLEQRARIQGVFTSVWGVSAIAGPLFGGALVDNVGWRWIFYLNVPVAIPAIVLLAYFFHERTERREHTLDVPGASLLSLGLTSILLLLLQGGSAWAWTSWQTALLAAITIVCLGLFLRIELSAAEPVIPLDLFRNRIIAVSAVGAFFIGAVLICISFEVPLYVQGVLGKTALDAGIALAPMSIGWPLAAAFSGKLALRFGYRATATTGALFQIAGLGLLLRLGRSSSFFEVALDAFVIGVGLGLSSSPLVIAVQSAVAWAQRGVATASNLFVRSFGSVVGLAVMGAIVNHATASYGGNTATNRSLDIHARNAVPPQLLEHIRAALLRGVHGAFLAAFIAAVVSTFVVLSLPGGSARDHQLQQPENEPEQLPQPQVREA